jgi:methanogenic corrinoid protein MtbC1
VASDLGSIRGAYLDEIRAGRRDRALDLVVGPVERDEIDLPTFYDEVLGPVAAKVGDLWHAGTMSVAEEHLATTVNRAARLRAVAHFQPARPNGRHLLLACAPEEQHELGLLMAADVLELAGYSATVLGARTPARDLAAMALALEVDAVVVSCSSPLTITGLLESVQQVHAHGIRVLVGGRAVRDYPAVAIAAGADATCVATGDVVDAVDALLSS